MIMRRLIGVRHASEGIVVTCSDAYRHPLLHHGSIASLCVILGMLLSTSGNDAPGSDQPLSS